jgi:type 1 glutamine amidotransferase
MRTLLVLSFFLLSSFSTHASEAARVGGKIKVLVLTGGHGFKAGPFFKIFEDNTEIAFTAASHGVTPTQSATAYERDDLFDYDVVVLYDSPSLITDAQKARFLALFDRGIGVIVLHHAYLSYPMWADYERIAGGKYVYLDEQMKDGITSSDYTRQMVEIPVAVAGGHPVTADLRDFVLRDELYTNMHMVGKVTPLLKKGDQLLAWARREGKSRIVGTILGHGPSAYENPAFRKFLAQSIQWVARGSSTP